MNNEIYVVKRATSLEEIKDLNYFDRRKNHKKLALKLEKKCPITTVKQECGQLVIYEIILPIITTIKTTLNEEYIIKIIDKFNLWVKDYYLDCLILDSGLKRYRKYFRTDIVNCKFLNLLFINKVLNCIYPKIDKDLQELKLVIVASGQSLTKFVLNQLIMRYNYITIFTEDVNYYNKYSIELYGETGLLIQVKDINYQKPIEGDIVIDCSDEPNKLFYFYNKNAFVVYGLLDNEYIYRNKSKRNDLHFVGSLMVSCEEFMNSDFFMCYLMAKSRIIRGLVKDNRRDFDYEDIEEYLKQFEINVDIEVL